MVTMTKLNLISLMICILKTCIAALISISSLSLSGKDRLMVSHRATRHKEKRKSTQSQTAPAWRLVKVCLIQRSRCEELQKAGRERLPRDDLLQDFLRERRLRSGAVTVTLSLILISESPGCSSSPKRCIVSGAGDVHGDFWGGPEMWLLLWGRLTPWDTSET